MPQPPRITTSSGGAPPGLYTNDANIAHTPWDFVVTFSQLVPAPPDLAGPGTQNVNEIYRHTIIRLLMSPQHLKAFSKALVENIEKYEAVYGEIPDTAAAAERHVERLVREGVIPADAVEEIRRSQQGGATPPTPVESQGEESES